MEGCHGFCGQPEVARIRGALDVTLPGFWSPRTKAASIPTAHRCCRLHGPAEEARCPSTPFGRSPT